VEANPKLAEKIEKELVARKLEGFVDELTTKADASKTGMSEKDLAATGARAKELIRAIAASEKISPEVIVFLSDIKHVIADKLGGMNLKSLTHILESIVDGAKIPPNPKIAAMLREYGDISQADFFAIVTIFHDLDKSFMPAQFSPISMRFSKAKTSPRTNSILQTF
jgi:hypothetical protein